MSGEPKGLPSAFAKKEQVEGFLTNLEKLKRDGSVTQEQYTIAREEYQQRLDAAIGEIDRIKNELRKQLEANNQELKACKEELGRLEDSYREGKLPPDEYRSALQELRAKIEALGRDSQSLLRLIRANRSADIGVTAKMPTVAVRELPVREEAVPTKRTKLAGGRLWAAIGAGVVVVAVVVGVLVLGLPGGREEAQFPPDSNGGAASPSEQTTEVRIPVNAQGAATVGSLHLELFYDSEVLHAIRVENGTVIGDAMLEYSVDAPGQVVIGIISANGINGNGSLAAVTFEVEGESNMTTSLELENVVAHDAVSLTELSSNALAGDFAVEGRSFRAPILVFTPGGS